MATIKLCAHHAQPRESGNGAFAVIFHLTGKPDPFPSRKVDVRTTAEALAAFDAFERDAKAASAAPMALCMRIVEGRTPNGFKAATARQFYRGVNV